MVIFRISAKISQSYPQKLTLFEQFSLELADTVSEKIFVRKFLLMTCHQNFWKNNFEDLAKFCKK